MGRDLLNSGAAQSILRQAVASNTLAADGTQLTSPRSWGVYEIEPLLASPANKRFRIGNHPVRQRELAAEFGDVTQVAVFTSRTLAEELARLLNG